MYDLNAFQRDILRRLAIAGGVERGLEVKEQLEDHDGYAPINHGRLYPNLDVLVDMGLVKKEPVDLRTNSYTLTRRGRREVEVHAKPWAKALESIRAQETEAVADGDD